MTVFSLGHWHLWTPEFRPQDRQATPSSRKQQEAAGPPETPRSPRSQVPGRGLCAECPQGILRQGVFRAQSHQEVFARVSYPDAKTFHPNTEVLAFNRIFAGTREFKKGG